MVVALFSPGRINIRHLTTWFVQQGLTNRELPKALVLPSYFLSILCWQCLLNCYLPDLFDHLNLLSIHPCIHLPIHPLPTHSPIHPLTHLPLIHPHTNISTHLFIHPPIHLLTHNILPPISLCGSNLALLSLQLHCQTCAFPWPDLQLPQGFQLLPCCLVGSLSTGTNSKVGISNKLPWGSQDLGNLPNLAVAPSYSYLITYT